MDRWFVKKMDGGGVAGRMVSCRPPCRCCFSGGGAAAAAGGCSEVLEGSYYGELVSSKGKGIVMVMVLKHSFVIASMPSSPFCGSPFVSASDFEVQTRRRMTAPHIPLRCQCCHLVRISGQTM